MKSNQQHRVEEVVKLGAIGALLKPYGMLILRKMVREVIDSKSQRMV